MVSLERVRIDVFHMLERTQVPMRLVGPQLQLLRPFRPSIPLQTIQFGLFLALCDAAARALPLAATPPVGVVTAALGAPALVFLLARKSSVAG